MESEKKEKLEAEGWTVADSPDEFFDKLHESVKQAVEIHRTQEATCCKCLAKVGLEEYLKNDHYCAGCAEIEDYPLAASDGSGGLNP